MSAKINLSGSCRTTAACSAIDSHRSTAREGLRGTLAQAFHAPTTPGSISSQTAIKTTRPQVENLPAEPTRPTENATRYPISRSERHQQVECMSAPTFSLLLNSL